jgi:hypothetical protein
MTLAVIMGVRAANDAVEGGIIDGTAGGLLLATLCGAAIS